MSSHQYPPSQEWRDPQSLPRHSGFGWAVWSGRPIPAAGIEDVACQLRMWHPLQTVLIGAPGRSEFLPPTDVPELERLAANFRRRLTFNLCMVFLISLALLAAAASMSGPEIQPLYAAPLAIFAVMAVDAVTYSRHPQSLSDRSRFYFWVATSRRARIAFVVWLLVGLAMGGVQLLLQSQTGNLDVAIGRYGTYFESIHQGQYWRLFSGPYLHASLVHYLTNALAILCAGALAWMLVGAWSLLLFMLGNVAAAFAQMLFASPVYEAYVGVSGGLFTLYGFIVAAGLTDQKTFPRGFTAVCAVVALTSLVGAELVAPNSATVAHSAGLMFGFGVGGIYFGVKCVREY